MNIVIGEMVQRYMLCLLWTLGNVPHTGMYDIVEIPAIFTGDNRVKCDNVKLKCIPCSVNCLSFGGCLSTYLYVRHAYMDVTGLWTQIGIDYRHCGLSSLSRKKSKIKENRRNLSQEIT